MVVLDLRHRRGEAERARQLHLVLGLVGAVASASFALEELYRGQRIFACQLGHIVHNAVLIKEFSGLVPAAHLIFQHKLDVAVDNRLPLERIQIIIHRDVDIREYLQIGLPADGRAGFARVRRLLGVAFLGAGLVFALFKVQAVLEAVTDNGDVHVLRGILRRAGTETVETK